jgi:hypothetical protein
MNNNNFYNKFIASNDVHDLHHEFGWFTRVYLSFFY